MRPLAAGEGNGDDSPIAKLAKEFNLKRALNNNPKTMGMIKALGLFTHHCRTCAMEGDPRRPDFVYNFVQCTQCQSVYCRPCHTYYGNQCLICFIPLVAISRAWIDSCVRRRRRGIDIWRAICDRKMIRIGKRRRRRRRGKVNDF